MADLPQPESRKEQYLAKAAGMEVSDLPEPASREELYLDAIAEGGGGGGGTSDFNDLENRPKYAGAEMDGDTDIPSVTEAIEAAKGQARVLTAANYNYPESSPTSIATWLLDPGLYVVTDNIAVRTDTSAPFTDTKGVLLLVSGEGPSYISTTVIYPGNAFTTRYLTQPNGTAAGSYKLELDVSQYTGTSQSAVMSQNAVTKMVFADPATKLQVKIGAGAESTNVSSVAIGANALCKNDQSVAIGSYASTSVKGEVNIGAGTTSAGYNNTNYRLLTGVYDPQSAHDAATKGYVDTAIASAGGANTIDSTDWDNLWS